MKLTPIPLSDNPVAHPRNPYIKAQSSMACGNTFLHWIARHTASVEVVQAHKSEAEKYAEQWILQEAA